MKKILSKWWLASLLAVSSTPLFAALENYNIGTWNLQGSSASSESKWNINVRQLLIGTQAADILMVQEAGTLPATAVRTDRVIQPVGVGTPIEEYTWNMGTRTRPNQVYIYYSRVDVGANRVNLAIVSRNRADAAHIIHSSSSVLTARPAIGIQIGTDVFFSVHALSPSGNDAVSLIHNVNTYFSMASRQHLSWILVGDFNRSPTNLQSALASEPSLNNNTLIIAPTEPTHRSGNILDYAVAHNATGQAQQLNLNASLMFNQIRSQITSDHFPVSFRRR